MPHARSTLATLAVLTFAVALVGCGSDSSKSSSKPAASTTSPSTTSTTGGNPFTSAPAPADHFAHTLSFVAIPGGGLVLVGTNGHSLYLFDHDQGTTSACTGACAQAWPALKASGAVTVAAGLDANKASTTADGQVVYNGHLLYAFAADKSPGDTNGIAVSGWHVVSPLGTPMSGR
jgi:predicted lipoprotein with Yx(FWY)xxD motif